MTDRVEPEDPMTEPLHSLRPKSPRWTRTALRVSDMDRDHRLVPDVHAAASCSTDARTTTATARGSGTPDSGEFPFILVVAQFHEHRDPFAPAPIASSDPSTTWASSFPTTMRSTTIARGAKRRLPRHAGDADARPDRLHLHAAAIPTATWSSSPIDQGVYEKVREVWGRRSGGPETTSVRFPPGCPHSVDTPGRGSPGGRDRVGGGARGRETRRRSVVEGSNLGHVLETVSRGRWIVVRGHRQLQFHPTDIAAIPAVHLAQFAGRRGFRRHRRHAAQHHDPGFPQDVTRGPSPTPTQITVENRGIGSRYPLRGFPRPPAV